MKLHPLAIYVHIPFCAKHCAYCDFNTYVVKSQSEIVQDTVEAVCADIRAGSSDRPVSTIFFGGGTPTFLSGAMLEKILTSIHENFNVDADAEISSEANPGSSDILKFEQMHAAGFNRLSIGVQSFDDELLIALDRFHSSTEAETALKAARTAGFKNLNLDLMFGLPKQTINHWEQTLKRAVEVQTEHLSLYAMTLEAGTRFERLYAGGKLDLPEEDTELEMYEQSIERLSAAGYEHYEVSNFAKPGFRSRHNQVYWRNEEYLGFGPGAVSYLDGTRWKKERLPARYIAKVRASQELTVESEALDVDGQLGETMMLGLRLIDGISLARIRDRFQIEPLQKFAAPLANLSNQGLLKLDGDVLRLTHRGLLIANTVLAEFIAVPD